MIGGAVGLPYAGISEQMFNPAAPLCACRLCGRVYQTPYHRKLYDLRRLVATATVDLLTDNIEIANLTQKCLDLGNKWRERHTKAAHTESEVEEFVKTGWAFTPVAAHRLAPFGIIPLGRMHDDIADSMYEASRAPNLTFLEGGE